MYFVNLLQVLSQQDAYKQRVTEVLLCTVRMID